MSLSVVLIGASAAAGAGYALMLERPPSALRTLVKTAAVASLAALAYLRDAPTGLVIALALSAIGDAFLAGDPERWLPFGLGGFLAAHIAYVWMFLEEGGGRAALAAEPARAGGVVLAFAAGVTMLAWLWRSLGALRPAVTVYALALSAMVAAALTLPRILMPAMVGAALFMASDAILSAELFKSLRSRLSGQAVWWLYYAAQASIAYAYLR
jgi:uncharacterized membrane protein YhhN